MTSPSQEPGWDAAQMLGGFARACRAAGLPVTADRERTFLLACSRAGLRQRGAVYWAGRATLTAAPADVEPYDRVFTGWFGGTAMNAVTGNDQTPMASTVQAPLGDDEGDGNDGGQAEVDLVAAAASAQEVLRHRDVAGLSPADRAALRRQFARLTPRPPRRRSRRHTPARRGHVDGRASVRAHLRTLGEPTRVRFRRSSTRRRGVVLLVDVSGSMSSYADSLLRLAHVIVQADPHGTEVFTIGTRLTQVTRALRERDPDRALLAAGEAVPDWSGGTRLGESLAAFLRRWGRRGMARGAVVVVFSDGWERQAPEALGEQVRAIKALAHRVIWVNPHRGKVGYQPIQAGIVAALPHVDHFVAGHSLAAFEKVLEVVADA